MGFVLGLVLSAMLIICIFLEMFALVRPVFSILFLGGVIGLFFLVFSAGLLLTPLFIFGFIINIPIIILALAAGGGKDDRK